MRPETFDTLEGFLWGLVAVVAVLVVGIFLTGWLKGI